MIRIQTFGETELREAAVSLLSMIDESGFRPDLVISIAQGGTYVVQTIEDELQRRNIPVAAVLCQRPSTRAKGRLRMRAWITGLPLSVRNGLRMVEHYLRAVVDRFKVERERKVTLESPETLAGLACSRILIIDDAADSGETLSAVQLFLTRKFPASDIRSGVLTQTRRRTSHVADYRLFNSVLIRFPWSNDFRVGDETSDVLISSPLIL